LSEISLSTDGVDALEFFGAKDSKFNILKKAFPEVHLTHRGNTIKISGEKKLTQKVKSKVETLIKLLKDNDELSKTTIMDVVEDINPYVNSKSNKDNGNVIVYGNGGKKITARTRNQKRLV